MEVVPTVDQRGPEIMRIAHWILADTSTRMVLPARAPQANAITGQQDIDAHLRPVMAVMPEMKRSVASF
jgi:hypothetical protein